MSTQPPWSDDPPSEPGPDDALRDLLGPAADVPAPPSPDDRGLPGEPSGGIIPGTGRRAEDHAPTHGPRDV